MTTPEEPKSNPHVFWNVGGRDPDEIPDAEYEAFLRALHGDAFTPDLMNGTGDAPTE